MSSSMNIGPLDREILRKNKFDRETSIIGKIVEHRTQDPKEYAKLRSKKLPIKQTKVEGINENGQYVCDLGISYTPKYPNEFDTRQILEKTVAQLKGIPIPFDQVEKNAWLNMNDVEVEKLEWMSQSLQDRSKEINSKSSKFDREGRLVFNTKDNKSDEKLNDTKNLDDQVFDLETLISFLDSTYSPRVTYGLNVISRIALWANCSYYDETFDSNIQQVLIEQCLLRVRHLIDSTNETTFFHALICLRSIICNCQLDEVILDRMFTITQRYPDVNLWLFPKNQYGSQPIKSFTTEMKDSECISIDPVLTLIDRTNILDRFSYILSIKDPIGGYPMYDIIIDILIRLSRHSIHACQQISDHRHLMNQIAKNFIKLPNPSKKYEPNLTLKSLKLIRIITQAVRVIHEARKCPLAASVVRAQSFSNSTGSMLKSLDISIIKLLEPYLAINIDEGDSIGLMLKMESMRCISILLDIDHFKNDASDICGLLFENLNRDCTKLRNLRPSSTSGEMKISLEWQYASILISLITSFIRENDYKISLWKNSLKFVVHDWLIEIISMNIIPHTDVSIAMNTSIICYYKIEGPKTATESIIKAIESEINIASKKAVPPCLSILSKLSSECENKSQLRNLPNTCGILRDPPNLPSYGCLHYNKTFKYEVKINSYIGDDSPFLLYQSFISIIEHCDDTNVDVLKVLLENCGMLNYTRVLRNCHKYSLEYESLAHRSLFAQLEIQAVAKTLVCLKKYYTLVEELRHKNSEIVDSVKIRDQHENLYFDSILALSMLSSRSLQGTEIRKNVFSNLIFDEISYSHNTTNAFSDPDKKFLILEKEFNHRPDQRRTLLRDIRNSFLPMLEVVYSCDKPLNRFWMFQPIVDYYRTQIVNKENKVRIDQWFAKRAEICGLVLVSEFTVLTDKQILTTILTMISILISDCILFSKFVIVPNVEESLASIGCLLLDDSLFFDEKLQYAILISIKSILMPLFKTNDEFIAPFKDATKYVPALRMCIGDFFNQLVDQFESVSYGDHLFTNFLLLFLIPGSDKTFRTKLFQEKPDTCLAQMRMQIDQVMIASSVFFVHKEEDSNVAKLMRRSLQFLDKGSFIYQYAIFHSGDVKKQPQQKHNHKSVNKKINK